MADNSKTNKTVLILAGNYLPGYKAGGPVRSIENLVNALGNEFRFKIVALDRDIGDTSPYPCVVKNQWTRVGNADVMYVPSGLLGLLRMVTLLHSVDQETVLYVNSYFARRFSMLALFMRWLGLCKPLRVVLAPRGSFSTGALRLKRRRKFLYIVVSQWLGFHNGIIWHASSELEASDIRRWFPELSNINIANVIPYINGRLTTRSVLATALDIARPEISARRTTRKVTGQLRAVFLSRISRMKNLLGALRILGGVSGDVTFDIYGPVEDARYWDECQAAIATLPANVQVRYRGRVEHEKVGQVFSDYDLLFLPTLGENYGHVICEALAAGCPVLISDQTPWRNLEEEGVGWNIPLDEPERFRTILQQCVDADGESYAARSLLAAEYATKCAYDANAVDANRMLFLHAFILAAKRDRRSTDKSFR